MENRYHRLFNEHQLLSKEHNHSKRFCHDLLWDYCLQKSPDFTHIPTRITSPEITESEVRIGEYFIDTTPEDLESKDVMLRTCHKAGKGKELSVFKAAHSTAQLNFMKVLRMPLRCYVMKTTKKSSIMSVDMCKQMERELSILTLLKGHPNVVSVYEVIHTRNNIHITSEVLPTNLFDFIKASQLSVQMGHRLMSLIMRKIVSGLRYLKEHRVAHRDIKPENIMLGFSNMVKSKIDTKHYTLYTIPYTLHTLYTLYTLYTIYTLYHTTHYILYTTISIYRPTSSISRSQTFLSPRDYPVPTVGTY